MDFGPQTTFKASQTVAWRDVNNEVVILNLKSGEYYTFNEVGQFIWKMAMQEKSIQEIREALLNAYDVSTDQAGKDLHEFFSGMVTEGMLHEEPPKRG